MKKVLSFIMALAMLFSLAACGAKRESAESVAEKAIQAVQNYDTEQMKQYWGKTTVSTDDANMSTLDEKCIKEIFKNLTYEIVSSEEKETTATVTVKFTNIDSSSVFLDAFTAALQEAFAHIFDEEYDEEAQDTFFSAEVLKNLTSGNYDMVTNEATIKLNLVDDQWVISEDNDEAFNAMCGDLNRFIEEMEKSFDGFEEDSDLEIISEARDWLVSDIWNNGICDMSWYYEYGTSSTGETLDPDFTLQQLAKAMEKKADYDSQMAALPDEYAEISELWVKVSEQVDILYKEIQARGTEVTGSGLDTGLYNQYFDAFDDAYFELS